MLRVVSYPPHSGPSAEARQMSSMRPMVPLLPPPPSKAPAPARRPPRPSPPAGFVQSIHAVPAAYPKTVRESCDGLNRDSHPFGDDLPDDKAGRNKALLEETARCVQTRIDAHEWEPSDLRDLDCGPLWLSAERWRREVPSADGHILVLTHACGLNKEHWYPTALALLGQSHPPAAFGTGKPLPDKSRQIDEVWFLEDAHHGASVDLNAGRLGPAVSWIDTARDVVNLVTHIIPAIKEDEYQLGWVDAPNYTPKKIIGVGHSYGATALIHASYERPELFEMLFLVEPMVNPRVRPQPDNPRALGALKRREAWPSIDAAAKLRTNPLFASWDADVFQLWLEHSLVPAEDGGVELATPSWAEAAMFCDSGGPLGGWDKLPHVKVPCAVLLAGNAMWLGGETIAGEIAWRAPRSRNERVPGSSHLLVQEKPREIAAAMARAIATLDAGVWDAEGRL